jgi:hypothetical protein
MSKSTREYYICKFCGTEFASYFTPIIGKPCPYPDCPVYRETGRRPIVSGISRAKLNSVTGVVGVTLSAAVAANFLGWWTVISGVIIVFLSQFLIALLIFGLLIRVIERITKRILPPSTLKFLLIFTVFASLPIVTILVGRPIDLYQIFVTIVLGIATNIMSGWILNIETRKVPAN